MSPRLRPAGHAPQQTAEELAQLTQALSEQTPSQRSDNLLLATWNIRGFGEVSRHWRSSKSDSPKRDWSSLRYMAAVLGRFDVIAVQETRRATSALLGLMDLLGKGWGVIVSDVTDGDAGNGERLTFIYNRDRVQPSGLVGEIVLPPAFAEDLDQFARTPYVASFVRGGVPFTLATVHVVWGTSADQRLPELTAFANWMRAWVAKPDDWNQNMLVLGDFNLDRLDDPLYAAFVSTGLWAPPELNKVPRTIFDDSKTQHHYDQVAWFSDVNSAQAPSMLTGLSFKGRAGSFNFVPHVFTGLSKTELSWRISDHYPLWIEFELDKNGETK